MRELSVVGVRVELPSNQPIVLLREVDGDRYLPIWIGAVEATAIAYEQQGVKPARPLTHDLLRDILSALQAPLKAVEITELKDRLGGSKNIAEFVDFLKANDYRFAGNQAVRAAEQLPLASLRSISGLQVGQGLLNVTPNGATVVVIAGARSQPVTLDQARPAIELFLLNERKRELVAKDLKAQREAAKIEYVGAFAKAASAPAPAASEPLLPASAGTR